MSVASFFVSRVDSLVDKLLAEKIAANGKDSRYEALLGQAAIANARLAYVRFKEIFSGPQWTGLADKGARVQRPLWASTSAKNPRYRDVRYVEELVGPDTVNTMPPATLEALKDHDLVCVHVEAPDEASHEGRADAKVKALEEIDRHIVGPLLDALPRHGDWRILVSPDHRTPLRTRAHAYGMVPFALAGTGISPKGQASYDEVTAEAGEVAFEKGHELMKLFLG